jgi:glutamine amidotransferase
MGFKAAGPVPLFRHLIGGDNSFAAQSLEHPDGWGVAYYGGDGGPTVVRSVLPAICDELFEQLSFDSTSATVLAHIRRATVGKVARQNCHPFRHGAWVFAHNGTLQSVTAQRPAYLERIAPALRPSIAGQTDSEIYFHLFLSALAERTSLDDPRPSVDQLRGALADAVGVVRGLDAAAAVAEPSSLTCLVSNGDLLIGFCGGKPLALRCETDHAEPQVLFSSEAISTRRFQTTLAPWVELASDELAVVDPGLAIARTSLV